ncbi:pseudaminic acid cytidylyltransferase [Alphaproteobacteria bacterium]|nr:pseudaminic acid cytidylyltransferase [Alphaproteobacteria bacterium]
MSLCVIPARGGSKRIPRKNIRIFNGKPMIVYAIELARDSGLFEHIVVSTDDEETAQVAREFGAKTPFIRSEALADDYSPTAPVVADAIVRCEALGWSIDKVCCIYPCVPLIQVSDLQETFRLLESHDADYLFPIVEFPAAIQRALRLGNDGWVRPFSPKYELVRTQDLEPAFHDAGQFYWGKRDSWIDNPLIHSSGAGFVLPRTRVVDIDTDADWALAELIHQVTQPMKGDL